MTNATSQLPLMIRKAIKAIEALPERLVLDVSATKDDRRQKMHAQGVRSLQKLCVCFIAHFDLGTGTLVTHWHDQLHDMTISDMVQDTGVQKTTVSRIMKAMKIAGFFEADPQNVHRSKDDPKHLCACTTHRRLTRRFWELLGLWADIQLEMLKRQAAGNIQRVKQLVAEFANPYQPQVAAATPALTDQEAREREELHRLWDERRRAHQH